MNRVKSSCENLGRHIDGEIKIHYNQRCKTNSDSDTMAKTRKEPVLDENRIPYIRIGGSHDERSLYRKLL